MLRAEKWKNIWHEFIRDQCIRQVGKLAGMQQVCSRYAAGMQQLFSRYAGSRAAEDVSTVTLIGQQKATASRFREGRTRAWRGGVGRGGPDEDLVRGAPYFCIL